MGRVHNCGRWWNRLYRLHKICCKDDEKRQPEEKQTVHLTPFNIECKLLWSAHQGHDFGPSNVDWQRWNQSRPATHPSRVLQLNSCVSRLCQREHFLVSVLRSFFTVVSLSRKASTECWVPMTTEVDRGAPIGSQNGTVCDKSELILSRRLVLCSFPIVTKQTRMQLDCAFVVHFASCYSVCFFWKWHWLAIEQAMRATCRRWSIGGEWKRRTICRMECGWFFLSPDIDSVLGRGPMNIGRLTHSKLQ